MLKIHFLGSGSRGNSTLVCWQNTRIMIDCGFTGKEIARRLVKLGQQPDLIDAVLLTHEHKDHTSGLAALARTPGRAIYCTEPTARKVYFGKKPRCARETIEPGQSFRVAQIKVSSFPTSHDAAQSVGFVLRFPDGSRLGYASDLGYASAEVISALKGCEYLALESNHDPDMLKNGPYPWILKKRIKSDTGHLANGTTAALLPRIVSGGLRHLFALHMSQTNNTPELVARTLSPALAQIDPQIPLTIIGQNKPYSFCQEGQLGLFEAQAQVSAHRRIS